MIRTSVFCLTSFFVGLASAVPAQVQSIRIIPPIQIEEVEFDEDMLTAMQAAGGGVVDVGGAPMPSPKIDPKKQPPSETLKAFLKLKFDRRPSTALEAWAKSEPKPFDEDKKVKALRAEIAKLEAEIAADAVKKAAAGATDSPVDSSGASTEPLQVVDHDEVDQNEVDQNETDENEPFEEPVQVSAGGVSFEVDENGKLVRVDAEDGAEVVMPGTKVVEGGAAVPAGGVPVKGAVPVGAVHPKQGQLDAKKKELEKRLGELGIQSFTRDVTLGRWDRVASFLAELGEVEGPKAYQHLLKTLPLAPPKRNNRVPQNLAEKNAFSFEDVVALAAAAPAGIEKKASEKNITFLSTLARSALTAGHASEELLAILRREADRADAMAVPESSTPDAEAGDAEAGDSEAGSSASESATPSAKVVLSRRQCALLLAALSRDQDLGDFLPDSAAAIESNDRQALNLLSRFHLALYENEKRVVHLEQAWAVTQAALAAGKVAEKEKAEALRRAVNLAPKIRAELGEAWLAESFTKRPDRGREILATIGSQASQGFETHAQNKDVRLEGMQLQRTAVDALLKSAPERAQEWQASLALMAINWMREASHSYQFSEATSRGPQIQRDNYGNIFYRNYGSQGRTPVTPIEPGELLELRPDGRWAELLDVALKPRFTKLVAELYLKVGEEVEAFPFIETLAQSYPDKAKELAEEFLRVWTSNHNPNVANNRTDPYMFIYGFDQRKAAIPLTRSKQERNLKDLAKWIAKIRDLPIEPVDETLVVSAFTSSHSVAEVYRLERVEAVFGSLDKVDPTTIARLVQRMRGNLASVWRQPATQQGAKTNRKKKDIEREVLGGYETARSVVVGALAKHSDNWGLHAALAALGHDENNYRKDVAKSSEFAGRRRAALDSLAMASALYAATAENLTIEQETVESFELWFYAALGACDLGSVDDSTVLAKGEPAKIREAILELPGESAERHMGKFANLLFSRMSAVNPAVKLRYLKAGFEIVGDHPQAAEARKVFEYYNDLVTEISLQTIVDGDDRVGHEEPFGVRINLRHTREIEREAGGFAKYLQNQNAMSYAYNYGRPLENYRDKFRDAATEALSEHFDVLSLTFNSDGVNSKADDEYGWRVTPYAYALLKARGPEVDKLPSLSIDLDFTDTSGYAVVPVGSPPVAIDASTKSDEPRPYEDLVVTQILDEREASEGKLKLEVKATAGGLVPNFADICELTPSEFEIETIDDQGLAISRFGEDQQTIMSERIWMVTLKARGGLDRQPETFEFAEVTDMLADVEYQRYVDADLIASEKTAKLDETYGRTASTWWIWLIGVLVVSVFGFGIYQTLQPQDGAAAFVGRAVPEAVTPFSVLALLRDIENSPSLAKEDREELSTTMARIESGYFSGTDPKDLDLEQIAHDWVRRAG